MAISSNNVQVYTTLYQLRLHFYQHSKSIAILVNNAFKTVQQSAKDAVTKTIPSSPSHPHASDK